jgi:hypothetical protein
MAPSDLLLSEIDELDTNDDAIEGAPLAEQVRFVKQKCQFSDG